jgi:hypothetical protein
MEVYADLFSSGVACLALIFLMARHKELNDMGQTNPRFSTLYKIKRVLYALLSVSHTIQIIMMIIELSQDQPQDWFAMPNTTWLISIKMTLQFFIVFESYFAFKLLKF